MKTKRYWDPEMDRLVDEAEIKRQHEVFSREPWFNKSYEQFKHDNFYNEDHTEIKEEVTMKIEFTTVNGTTFTTNEQGNYFYMINAEGKKIRIKKAEFETAQRENEIERAIAEVEESNTTEAIEEIQKEMNTSENKPKTKKTRKNKDAALTVWVNNGELVGENEGTMLQLTAKQVDFIKHLPDTDFWDNGVESSVWIDILCDDIGGQFAGKPMTVGAMISTLCEKNVGARVTERRDGRKCTGFHLTELGKKIATKLGL